MKFVRYASSPELIYAYFSFSFKIFKSEKNGGFPESSAKDP